MGRGLEAEAIEQKAGKALTRAGKRPVTPLNAPRCSQGHVFAVENCGWFWARYSTMRAVTIHRCGK